MAPKVWRCGQCSVQIPDQFQEQFCHVMSQCYRVQHNLSPVPVADTNCAGAIYTSKVLYNATLWTRTPTLRANTSPLWPVMKIMSTYNKFLLICSSQICHYLNPSCPVLGTKNDCHGLTPSSNCVPHSCSLTTLSQSDGENQKNKSEETCGLW